MSNLNCERGNLVANLRRFRESARPSPGTTHGRLIFLSMWMLAWSAGLIGCSKPKSVTDGDHSVTTGTFWSEHFTLATDSRLDVLVEVKSGDFVNCYLMDANGKKAYDAARTSPRGGGFQYVMLLSKEGISRFQHESVVTAGEWYFVVDVKEGIGVPSRQKPAEFHVKLTATAQ